MTDLVGRIQGDARDCTASPTIPPTAALPATACSPGGWPSGTCDSCSSCTAAGTSTATCPHQIRGQCKDVDQPAAALVKDLKQRGLLDETLVIWGGEFGRTVYSQGAYQRQLRPRPSRPLLHDVGGGRRHQAGHHLGRNRRLLLQHRQRPRAHPRLQRHDPALHGHRPHTLTFKFQGRDFRLTDVHGTIRCRDCWRRQAHPFLIRWWWVNKVGMPRTSRWPAVLWLTSVILVVCGCASTCAGGNGSSGYRQGNDRC